jgi:hypothetical protein
VAQFEIHRASRHPPFRGIISFMAKDRDFFLDAKKVVEQAIGEKMDGSPLEKPLHKADPAAVKRGHAGGVKGGKSRANKLTPERRSEIAHKAATERWKKD